MPALVTISEQPDGARSMIAAFHRKAMADEDHLVAAAEGCDCQSLMLRQVCLQNGRIPVSRGSGCLSP